MNPPKPDTSSKGLVRIAKEGETMPETNPNARPLPALKRRSRGKARLIFWNAKFAAWLASVEKPSKAEQVEAATRLANDGLPADAPKVQIGYGTIKRLKRREDFRELVEKMSQGGIEAARATLATDMPLYMEMHRWGVMRAKEKDDVRAISSYTVPVMDRVAPKRSEVAISPTPIVVNMTPEQFERFLSPPPAITAEVVDLDELPPAPDLTGDYETP